MSAYTSDVLLDEEDATVVSPSTLVISRAEPSPSLEKAEAAEASLIEDGARVAGPISPPGTSAQSPMLTSGRPATPYSNYFSERDNEVALGYDDFLGELEELKALPLKEQRRRLKNEVFRVSFATIPL